MNFDVLAQVLAAGLSLWSSKERSKYIDELIRIEKAYYEEFNKSAGARSDAVLDQLEFQLRVLSVAFASGLGKQDPASQP